MPLQIHKQFQLKEKKSSGFKDIIFKKADEVKAKIPSATSIKNVATEAAAITKNGLKDGLKKSATKVAGIGAAGATTAAVGKLAATGIGGVLVATGAGAAIASAVPLVVGITTTCILDSVVKSANENDLRS